MKASQRQFGIVLGIALLLLSICPTAHAANYDGTLRIYVVEPESRYLNDDGHPYHFGLLSYALVETLNIPEGTRHVATGTWNAASSGFSGVTEGNIMIQAVSFANTNILTDGYPPYGFFFSADLADAAAAATPAVAGRNTSDGSSTHTVFLEEGTAQWCDNCPLTSESLHNLYTGGTRNFIYTALVGELIGGSQIYPAYSRLTDDYNNVGYPHCYFDGGSAVVVGDTTQGHFDTILTQAEQRVVNDIDLVVSMDWTADGEFDYLVRIGYGTSANVDPVTPNAPDHSADPQLGVPVEFDATTTDADGDSLWYYWDITGDLATNSGWQGPYASGATATWSYTFATGQSFEARVRVKDEWSDPSDYSPATALSFGCCDNRADVNQSGGFPDISDLVYLVAFMFTGGPAPECMEEADINASGDLPDISDLVYLVAYMFTGGPPPIPCP